MKAKVAIRTMIFRLVLGIALAATAVGSATATITTPAEFIVIMDHESGEILYEKNANTPTKPASMAKLMTIYLLFEQIDSGSLRLDDSFIVSEKAYRRGGSRTFLELGSQVSVSDLLLGIIVQSGNDAAIVVAEGLAGTEEAFAQTMTATAKKLGMRNTVFGNSTGWPDDTTTTTALDLALLARAIIRDFPEQYTLFAEQSFTYNEIEQPNRNPLLAALDYADGLKTGHTEESGYGLVASGVRDGHRMILVLNGLESNAIRKQESIRLMGLAFRLFKKTTLLDGNETVAIAPVYLGVEKSVEVIPAQSITRILQQADIDSITRRIELNPDIRAPIAQGEQLGEALITMGDEVLRYPLVAAVAVERLPWYLQIVEFFKVLIFGQTPVPQTPVPQTPVPQTPVPQTPVSQTPVSQTPVPQTQAPTPTPTPIESQ